MRICASWHRFVIHLFIYFNCIASCDPETVTRIRHKCNRQSDAMRILLPINVFSIWHFALFPSIFKMHISFCALNLNFGYAIKCETAERKIRQFLIKIWCFSWLYTDLRLDYTIDLHNEIDTGTTHRGIHHFGEFPETWKYLVYCSSDAAQIETEPCSVHSA